VLSRLYADESMEASNKVSESQSPHLDIIDRLTKSTVAVVGLGGVGSWAAEALCRSGIGNIILIDLDEICISNTNRQLHALESTVGKSKIDEMKSRLLDINPCCNITTIHDFVSTSPWRNFHRNEHLLGPVGTIFDLESYHFIGHIFVFCYLPDHS